MLDDLTLMVGSIFDLLTSIFNLYTGTMVLTGVLALWLLRKVVKIFRQLLEGRIGIWLLCLRLLERLLLRF